MFYGDTFVTDIIFVSLYGNKLTNYKKQNSSLIS